jgi:hypothetical protein
METDLPEQLRDLIEAGGPPVTLTELADRRTPSPAPIRGASPRPPAQRSRAPRTGLGPRPGWIAATAAGIIVVGGGALAATQLGGTPRPGPSPAAARHSAKPGAKPGGKAGATPGRPQAVLTASMVHRLARASKAALAAAGHVRVSYCQSDGGDGPLTGTDDLTFAGKDYNFVSQQSGSKIGPWTDRAVHGQEYEHGQLAPGQPARWYHSTSETSHAGQSVPDPGKLLGALQPSARFSVIGTQFLHGVQVQHLRAADTSQLPAGQLSFEEADPSYRLAALDVWVDARGVIRQMHLKFTGSDQGIAEVTTLTVRFLDIGLPEHITAPAHYVNQVTHG